MKNLQKFAVALLVGIMAVGFSAFKADKLVLQENIYGLNSTGTTYTKISSNGVLPSGGECVTNPAYQDCYVSFSDANDPNASFSSSSIPGTAERSGDAGFWDN